MKADYLIIVVLLATIFILENVGFTAIPDANHVKAVYKEATVSCTVCHREGNFKALNSYGQAYNDAGRNLGAVQQIDEIDSDGDGISNADEINNGSNPGEAEVE
ncbi:MAG: thrombospondin type 3 repeat-containing protein [Candidatus Omnitrophota bacterium]